MFDHLSIGVSNFSKSVAFYDTVFQALGIGRMLALQTEAIAQGGTDEGAPGIRSHYHPNYYAAYVLDLDGYKLEAVCHEPG
jgi:hypothetical protein